MSFPYLLKNFQRISTRILLTCVAIIPTFLASGQELTLNQCYEAAQNLTPLAQQNLYYQSIATLQRKNAASLYRPQIAINGQFTYQSDVFSLPFENPGVQSPEIPKDQYRLALGINQTIFDGGSTKRTLNIVESEAEANQQEVAVALYQIRGVINELFFGALVSQENTAIMEAQKAILEQQLLEVESSVKNGALLASNADIVRKGILSVEQNLISFRMDKVALLEMLEAWIGEKITENTTLKIPELTSPDNFPATINRPELRLFELRSQQLQAQSEMASIRNYPKISAFVDGGIANPNPFNFYKTDLSGYYLAGVRLRWNLFDWNQNKNDIRRLDIQRDIITSNRDDFERRVGIEIIRDNSEIRKIESLLEKDIEILALQERITKETYAQLQNGIITSTNYITELNNETAAKLAVTIRELSLVRTKIELLTKSGNYENQN